MTLHELEALVGQEVAVTDWIAVTQEKVDEFAHVTGDRQWIHTDPERAARESRYGSTVAHGFLVLALLPCFLSAVRVANIHSCINCGVNYARFLEPVTTGSRIRARLRLSQARRTGDDVEATWYTTIERETSRLPSCIVEWRVRYCGPPFTAAEP